MRKTLLFLFLLIVTTNLKAQNFPSSGQAQFNSSGNVRVIPSALITVCSGTVTTVPCTPTTNIFTQTGATLANPFNADVNGNYLFYAPVGSYTVSITGVGVTGQNFFVALANPSATAIPSGVSGNLVKYTGAATVGDSGVPANSLASTTVSNTWTASQTYNANVLMKGPTPWADITASGARAGDAGATITQTNSGSPNVTLASSGGFQNGDGIVLPGVGAANTMVTPVSGPTVTPSLAAGPTGTEQDINSPTGVSNYKYCYFAFDKNHNVTACSPTTTIVNGLSTLGLQTATLSNASRSNDTTTFNTTASTNLVTGAVVDIVANTPLLTGWAKVCSTPGGSQFTTCINQTDTRVIVNQLGDPSTTTVTGGSLAFIQDNRVVLTAVTGAWGYGICSQRVPYGDAALHLIGQTKPQGPGSLTDLVYDDYGPIYHANQTFPAWMSDANCTGAASTNGQLSSTIIAGGGTTSITLADNAQATVTTGTANLDACPGLKAAVNVALSTALLGPVYIPPTSNAARSYPIRSFCSIATTGSGGPSIKQAGSLILYDTIQLNGQTLWDGSFASGATQQFATNQGATISTINTLPGIYATGTGNVLQNLNISGGSQNGDMLIVTDNSPGFHTRAVNLDSAGGNSNDLLGMDMLNRDSSGTVVDLTMEASLLNGGPDQVTDKSWTPLVWQSVGSFYNNWWHTNNSRRGVVLNGSVPVISWFYSQGLINPQFTFVPNNNSQIRFENIYHDTDGQPTLFNNGSTVGQQGAYVLKNVNGGSNPGNPAIQGTRPIATFIETGPSANSVADPVPNRGTCKQGFYEAVAYPFESTTVGNEAFLTCSMPIQIPSKQPIYWTMAPPSSVTATVAAGGSVPTSVNGWVYSVAAIAPDGTGRTTLQPVPSPACITTGGNQTCNIGWTNPSGSTGTDIWRCNLSPGPCTAGSSGLIAGVPYGNTTWFKQATNVQGTTYSDTAAANGADNSPPQMTAAGYPEITNVGAFTPAIQTGAVTNGVGLQIFNTTTTCTTGASVGATCTTASISLPVAEVDTSYRVVCTGKGLTNVPTVIATANSSATQFTITIAALTAAAASFASYDCTVGHN